MDRGRRGALALVSAGAYGACIACFARTWLSYLMLFCLRGHFDGLVDRCDRLASSASAGEAAMVCGAGGLIGLGGYGLLRHRARAAQILPPALALACVLALSTYHFRLISLPFGLAGVVTLWGSLEERRDGMIAMGLLIVFALLCFSPVDVSLMRLSGPAGFETMDYLAAGRGPFAPYVWAW